MEDIITIAGKRKTAVSKAKIKPGTGIVTLNGLNINHLPLFHKLALHEPIRIYESVLGQLKYDISIKTSGGGKEAQVEASRLTIANALIKVTGSEVLKKAFVSYDRNMVVEDSRRKEARKPGDSKARAKRQKSYR
jgi:small subunit ribosomal protein S9